MTPWDKRFFSSTRGQVVTLLRTGDATVDELAAMLELTDNAVRSHLSALERDGLVEQAGVRRGVSKPSIVYRLTREAERIFPKSDSSFLRTLLDVLRAQLSRQQLRDVFARTGQAAASEFAPAHGTLHDRVRQSAALLGELGGLAEVEESDSAYVIHGFSCPFAAASPDHPAVCQLAAAFLTEYSGAPVEAHCRPSDSNGAPRCIFEIRRPNAAGTGEPLEPTDENVPQVAGESRA